MKRSKSILLIVLTLISFSSLAQCPRENSSILPFSPFMGIASFISFFALVIWLTHKWDKYQNPNRFDYAIAIIEKNKTIPLPDIIVFVDNYISTNMNYKLSTHNSIDLEQYKLGLINHQFFDKYERVEYRVDDYLELLFDRNNLVMDNWPEGDICVVGSSEGSYCKLFTVPGSDEVYAFDEPYPENSDEPDNHNIYMVLANNILENIYTKEYAEKKDWQSIDVFYDNHFYKTS